MIYQAEEKSTTIGDRLMGLASPPPAAKPKGLTTLPASVFLVYRERWCSGGMTGWVVHFFIAFYKTRFIPGMSLKRIDIRNDPGIDRRETTTKRVKAPACTGSKAY